MKWSENETVLQLEFQIKLYNFKRRIKNKRDLWKRSLNEPEWHIAIGIPSSEWLTSERGEREHLHKTIKRSGARA
jgi:hypothetical protein